MKTVENIKGELVVVSRSGELIVDDVNGRERERYKLPYGAMISVNDGDIAAAGQVVATWDPHTHPVISEVAGKLKLEDFIDGVTVIEQEDEVTGLSSVVILDPKQRGAAGKDLRPTAMLVVPKGNDICFANTEIPAVYALPPGALVTMADGDKVLVGCYCPYPAGEFEDA